MPTPRTSSGREHGVRFMKCPSSLARRKEKAPLAPARWPMGLLSARQRCWQGQLPGKLLQRSAYLDTYTRDTSVTMLIAQPRSLLQRLSPYCTRLLETAAAECVSGGQDEVRVEHLVLALWSAEASDWQVASNHYGVDGEAMIAVIRRTLAADRRAQVGRPVFSRRLLEWIQDSWVWASVEMRATELRSGMLLARFVAAPEQYTAMLLPEIERIPAEAFGKELEVVCAASVEAPRAAAAPAGA